MPRAEFPYPIEGIQGRLGKRSTYYRKMKNGYFESRIGKASDPKTPDQMSSRAAFGAATRAWREFTREQCEAWAEYGRRHFSKRYQGGLVAPSPLNAFKAVAPFALAAGAAMPHAAPSLPPPRRVIAAEQIESDAADRFAFRVTHAIANPAGYRVLLKLSEPAAPGRNPVTRKRVWAAGFSAASMMPLASSGEIVEWRGARRSIGTGRDYAAELIVLSPEFVPSRPFVRVYRRVVN